jgi:methylmalonyl-CoA/ethylmalonyl-CoA epimerase
MGGLVRTLAEFRCAWHSDTGQFEQQRLLGGDEVRQLALERVCFAYRFAQAAQLGSAPRWRRDVAELFKARAGMPAEVTSASLFGRIDHIGVAVDDLEGAVALYEERLGMPVEHRERVEQQGVEAVLLGVGESHVELLLPLAADTAVGRFLERNGPGLHHVAYGTEDIEAALDAVRAAGLRLIDEQPRTGVRSTRVAFVHPESTGGVLTELVQAEEGH